MSNNGIHIGPGAFLKNFRNERKARPKVRVKKPTEHPVRHPNAKDEPLVETNLQRSLRGMRLDQGELARFCQGPEFQFDM